MRKSVFACSLLFIATTALSSELSISNAIVAKGAIFRVIDGDTILVNFDEKTFQKFNKYNNKKTRKNIYPKYNSVKIRISAVDSPESVHPDQSKNTARGKEASDFLQSWAEKQPATVKCFDIGYFGRFICNVSINNKRDIGREMIAHNYSSYVTRWGANPYLDAEYKEAEKGQNKW